MDLTVKGMKCGHCEAAVRRAIEHVAPVAEVMIDRGRNRVSVSGVADAGRGRGRSRRRRS